MKLATLSFAALCSCSANVATNDPVERPRFMLCDERASGFKIEVDFETLEAVEADIFAPVSFCEASTPCLTFPFYLSAPPTMPTSTAKPVHWSTEAADFTISKAAETGDTFEIRADVHAQSVRGNESPPTAYLIGYGTADGVTYLRSPDDPAFKWTRCQGEFHLSDIEKMRKRRDEQGRKADPEHRR